VKAELDDTLAALADPTRRLVVDLLAKGPQSAGALATAAGSSPPAMSRHLRVLRRLGLVEDRHDEADARVRMYSLRPARLSQVKGWLEDLESFWSDQLEGFKQYLEER
jgi:DNA-binding transcriptional ArsR family regulator